MMSKITVDSKNLHFWQKKLLNNLSDTESIKYSLTSGFLFWQEWTIAIIIIIIVIIPLIQIKMR